MIHPKGPKPTADRHPDSKEPRFDERGSGDDQPMYATEPDSPGGAYGPAAAPRDEGQGGWEIPDSRAPGQGGGPDRAAQRERPDPARQASAAAQPAGSGTDNEGELRAALAAAEAKAKESQEQYLRALAEMENVRRRAQEDVSKAHKFAIEGFAESLLPVRDSLEMALTVEVPSVESLREGVEATLRQLTQAFERNRLLVIDPLHQKFDPNRHQAISVAPAKDVAPNHVVSVLQKGYMINDRVLRPALVTVSQSG